MHITILQTDLHTHITKQRFFNTLYKALKTDCDFIYRQQDFFNTYYKTSLTRLSHLIKALRLHIARLIEKTSSIQTNLKALMTKVSPTHINGYKRIFICISPTLLWKFFNIQNFFKRLFAKLSHISSTRDRSS